MYQTWMWLKNLLNLKVTQQAVYHESDSTSCISWKWLNKLYILKVTQQAVYPEND